MLNDLKAFFVEVGSDGTFVGGLLRLCLLAIIVFAFARILL